MYFVYNHNKTLSTFSDLLTLETAIEMKMWDEQGKTLTCPASVIEIDPALRELGVDEFSLDYTFNPKRFHHMKYVEYLFELAAEYLGDVISLDQALQIVNSAAVNDRALIAQLRHELYGATRALPLSQAA